MLQDMKYYGIFLCFGFHDIHVDILATPPVP